MPKKKQARPEMSWVESRGKWRKRVNIGGRNRDIYGDTQTEVRNKVRELERQCSMGLVLDDNTILGEFAQEWYEVRIARLTPSGRDSYKYAFNAHIAPALGHVKMKDIRPLHVEKLMASKVNMSKSSLSKILMTLSQIMKCAVENGIVEKNPCANVKAGGRPPEKKIPLTTERQDMLIRSAEGTRAEIFVLLCLMAGLRREEALGLMWSSVYLEDVPYIEVNHTVTYDVNQPIHSMRLKSRAAHRKIPIPHSLARKLYDARSESTSTLVVPSAQGMPMSQAAFRRMWEIAVKKIDFHVTPHILRHTYITELCRQGIDIKKIQYLAGHEDVEMTLSIYAHVTENTPAELARILFPEPVGGHLGVNNSV